MVPLDLFQGYEGSLLKVTSKNGKTSSVSLSENSRNELMNDIITTYLFKILKNIFFEKSFNFFFQPVGFVTFNTRAGAEAAKQDLQVSKTSEKFCFDKFVSKISPTSTILQIFKKYFHTATDIQSYIIIEQLFLQLLKQFLVTFDQHQQQQQQAALQF